MMIRYVSGEIIVFEINNQIYYFRDSPNLPELFDVHLKKLIIPNLDNWLQTMTSQRYSLRGLRDMAVAFVDGLRCGISDKQARQLVINTILETRRQIFQSAFAADYARFYFIELIDPAKLETKYLPSITQSFSKLVKQHGADKLYNILCRFWQFCNYQSPSTAIIFETLIRRLGREPTTPYYSITTDLDKSLVDEVTTTVLRGLSLYNISDDIIVNVKKLK